MAKKTNKKSGTKTKKTTTTSVVSAKIPVALKKKAKAFCKQNGMTVGSMIAGSLTQFLETGCKTEAATYEAR